MPKPIRVAVVDPYPIFREAVVQTITRNEDLLLVAEGATAAEARAAVREAEPDVMLIDISIRKVASTPRSASPGVDRTASSSC